MVQSAKCQAFVGALGEAPYMAPSGMSGLGSSFIVWEQELVSGREGGLRDRWVGHIPERLEAVLES